MYGRIQRWCGYLVCFRVTSPCGTDGQTDRRTDGQARLVMRPVGRSHNNCTRGRVRAGPSLQLGTLSTRIANLLCIIHSALSRLSYARHTHSGLAALCRYSADRQTDKVTRDRHDLPTDRTPGQPAVLPVPSCKLGIISSSNYY